jgi:hypothetical protein
MNRMLEISLVACRFVGVVPKIKHNEEIENIGAYW